VSETVNYYNHNADAFFADTANVDMSALHARFLRNVPDGGLLLDAGCGSGRDSKAFLAFRYRVRAFDASPELARRASELIGQVVKTRTFEQVDEVACYDGIWACASLLHLPEHAMPDALGRLWSALKPGGVCYFSFKQGEGERTHNGRHFTDATEDRLNVWIDKLADVESIDCWVTLDQRPDRQEHWLNAIVRKSKPLTAKLISGERDHKFLPLLCDSIVRADEIDFTVAFIKTSGLRLLLPDLHVALAPSEGSTRRAARVRVVTSDYLDVTDPDALRLLMLLQAQGAQVRVFETAGTSFHMKAYLFAHYSDDHLLHGTAFIGSSNISRQALTNGLEWNYRVDYPADDGFLEARHRFECVFSDARSVPLTDAWIDAYETRRVVPPRAVAPGSDEKEAAPNPTPIQVDALQALSDTRDAGYRRGLVVLATGLGKTWLAAFDAQQMGARRVLFVAHREEILNQAAETFLRIRPRARVGFYMGQVRDVQVDILCASVQTLGRAAHLSRFAPQHFDYIVIDEFHHAAAPTYRQLLTHFAPQFLIGLTATPDRTDQSDILSLCDDNLVYSCNLFTGITAGLLAPFHYFGIWDESVNYKEIPWRNGRFDPEQLTHKLATLARARHALRQWRDKAQSRTLAFCVSVRHAQYMADQFRKDGIEAAAVYAGSEMSRGDALAQLSEGRLQVIFSVDLFSEGVDLPSIDTVLMLRPTESKILFLQQLGRGLRRFEGKEKLVVLDFIGNHHSFLHKPQALAQAGSSYRDMAAFARRVESQQLVLPTGCLINYDMALIDFLKSLDGEGVAKDYEALRDALGRRPSLAEFYRSGANVTKVRQQYGSWFELIQAMYDLSEADALVASAFKAFLREVETTALNLSYKMVLLEAFQELDGWSEPPTLSLLAQRSWAVLQRRRPLLGDVPERMRDTEQVDSDIWQRYWRDNPVNAWVGGNRGNTVRSFFKTDAQRFEPTFVVAEADRSSLATLVQELIDFRLASYEARQSAATVSNVIPFPRKALVRHELPYFPDLKIACGHFRTASSEVTEHRSLGNGHGRIDPARHFIARASGNSMNGGKSPIQDGDYLLFELVTPTSAGSVTGSVMAIERQDEFGDNQYLLRSVTKGANGEHILKAFNPDYKDMVASPDMRTLARLKGVIEPLELAVGQSFMREQIPGLFDEQFNAGSWHSGHVPLNDKKVHILLVTLNKQGKAEEQRYIDHWIDESHFHWQSQNATTPESKRGQEIIQHEKQGISIHLFVREHKLQTGKAAPFVYCGKASYQSHTGSAPISVVLEVGS
jgi:superfamily II DNA or RNA helicase/HKD family nuclease